MQAVTLVFPHQLFKDNPAIDTNRPVYLIEEQLFFEYQNFHKQKLVLHRASMQCYAQFLKEQNVDVHYVEAKSPQADTRVLLSDLLENGLEALHFCDPCDNYLEQRIANSVNNKVQIHNYDSPLFLNTKQDLERFFRPDKKLFRMATYYKQERIKRGILLDGKDTPVGGKWSFDKENRKKYPKGKTPPAVQFPDATKQFNDAVTYVEDNYANNYGELGQSPLYPINFDQATRWYNQFLEQRFSGFGPYEDAMVRGNSILHHSVLTPLLNIGLLTPEYVITTALAYAKEHQIALNTIEGFTRQIIGWRAFMRGMYVVKGTKMRTTNYWGFNRSIPKSFYNGTTSILPVDSTIKQVLQTGYCHHIERLMVLGNFMLLCEFNPDEVYRWFMELFIDSYDWVMVPNVYGMSQFADGGLFATKPYISSSNYIKKMSDFPGGEWEAIWDGLFWNFMNTQRDFFSGNPRLAMLLSNFDKMDVIKKQTLLNTATNFLNTLDS